MVVWLSSVKSGAVVSKIENASTYLKKVTDLIETQGYVPVKYCPYHWETLTSQEGAYFEATTPLHYAATLEDETMAGEIIALIMNDCHTDNERMRALETENETFMTPLAVAAYYTRYETVGVLLRYNARCDNEISPLSWLLDCSYAIRTASELVNIHLILKMLIKRGAKIITPRVHQSYPYLYRAYVLHRNGGLVQPLLQYGNHMSDELGKMELNYLLMVAVRDMNVDMVNVLLRYGANSNHYCQDRRKTPLMMAAQFCTKDSFALILRSLQSYGVNIDQASACGRTALSLAFAKWSFTSAVILIKEGANVNSLYKNDGSGDAAYCDDSDLYMSYPHYRSKMLGQNLMPDDYTVWLERYFDLRGLNRLLVYYGLDVKNMCSVNEHSAKTTNSVGNLGSEHFRSDGGKSDGGQELRSWLLAMKYHVEGQVPLTAVKRNTPACLMSICRDRLLRDRQNVDLSQLPKSVREYVTVLDVKTFNRWDYSDLGTLCCHMDCDDSN